MSRESLGKFPFKHMQAMIDAIASAGTAGVGISTIASAGLSCHPDTAETLAMAIHLGKNGKVVDAGDGTWVLHPPPSPAPIAPHGFRRRYLRSVGPIIDVLRDRPATAGDIARSTGMDHASVEAFLSFLANLTAGGRVEKQPGTTIYVLVPWGT